MIVMRSSQQRLIDAIAQAQNAMNVSSDECVTIFFGGVRFGKQTGVDKRILSFSHVTVLGALQPTASVPASSGTRSRTCSLPETLAMTL
jgi:hypothetical protein